MTKESSHLLILNDKRKFPPINVHISDNISVIKKKVPGFFPIKKAGLWPALKMRLSRILLKHEVNGKGKEYFNRFSPLLSRGPFW